MPKITEVVTNIDDQISLWETYRDKVMNDYQLTLEEANEWANEFMKYDFTNIEKTKK